MKELSRIAAGIHDSATMHIDSLYKQMKADGLDVIGFAAGEPDFPTPDHIKEAAFQAIRDNYTRYTPASGAPELKKAVCQRMKEDIGVEYAPNQVVISSGAKHLVYLALRALVNPGDEVILPTPAWVSYYELILMAGGTPILIETTEEEDFKLTPAALEAAITDKTKAIILNNPSNPTGMVYDAAQLKALADVCVRHDLYIVADEIYYGLVYDGKLFTSIAALGEEVKKHVILVNGVSKSYAMTGWRIGYALAEPDIAKIMANYVSHSTGSPCAISQKAAVTALTASQEEIGAMREAFQDRRDYMVERMNAMEGISCLKPEGAFYVMMNIKSLLGKTISGVKINNDSEFCAAFLEKGLVATVPGSSFSAPGFVRWSYANSMENIKAGLDRLEAFLSR